MVGANIKKHLRSLKLMIINKPDESIVIAGVVLAFALLIPSFLLKDTLWGDLAVNLSASMITVVLTVLLIDKLRQMYLFRELAEPRAEAIQRIKSSNNLMILFLSVVNFQQASGYKGFVKKDGFFDEAVHDNEVARLATLKPGTLKGFSNSAMRNSLRQSSESISRELISIRQNYDYAVGNDFRTVLNKMIHAIEGLKAIWVVYDLEPSTMQTFTDASGDDFVNLQLANYLKTYNEFTDKYKIDTASKVKR